VAAASRVTSRCRCGRGEPSPGADAEAASPALAQTWAGVSPVPVLMQLRQATGMPAIRRFAAARAADWFRQLQTTRQARSNRIGLSGIPACRILPRSEVTHRSVVAQLRRPDQVVDEGVVVRYALSALRDRQWRQCISGTRGESRCRCDSRGEPSPREDVAGMSQVPVQLRQGEPSPGADVGKVPSPGADVAGVSAVPVQIKLG
jgi:hypothetical protein